MHTGQFRVVRIHRSRFLARVVQNCGSKHHCKIVLPLLQSCRGGSPVSLVSNSVESRRDVFAGVGPSLCRTQLRKPGWLGLGLGTVGSFCGRIARTVTVSSSGMLAGADGATAIFNFTVNVGALAENDYRRDRS